jgi:hypothetical protein
MNHSEAIDIAAKQRLRLRSPKFTANLADAPVLRSMDLYQVGERLTRWGIPESANF